MTTIVWSKTGCHFCDLAKNMLTGSGIKFEERNISTDEWTKEQLLEAVPDAKSVPQIFVHGVYVGGFYDLEKYYEDHGMSTGGNSIV